MGLPVAWRTPPPWPPPLPPLPSPPPPPPPRRPPPRLTPALLLEPVQARVKLAVGPLDLAAGQLLDPPDDGVAVALARFQDREDQRDGRGRHEVLGELHSSTIHCGSMYCERESPGDRGFSRRRARPGRPGFAVARVVFAWFFCHTPPWAIDCMGLLPERSYTIDEG